jgi:hypothetical protein
MSPPARLAVGVLLTLATLVAAPAAWADLDDEQALAEKHAPVVRLVEQSEECGPGERYPLMDVDLLFDEPSVALRGPWNAVDLVDIAPSVEQLSGLYDYHLDYPGNALNPGCDYERWARRLTEGAPSTVYAHVATEAGRPGMLALQYWFFYPFNEFNNLHEGDWEMIQLVFEAGDAAEALAAEPVSVGYSSHEGAERADWGEDKLELVDGSRPVVYPGAGSHANKYTEALYIGSSAEEGVGCDDTRGPHVEPALAVRTIPSDAQAARVAFPWITYQGRWGELQEAFFNGPTGPNLKRQWTEPISWSEGWRDRSYAVPTGGLFGTGATDFFCSAVAKGSQGLVHLLSSPSLTLLVLGGFLALTLFAITRTSWSPATPLRLARRRTWGQIVAAAGRMYVRRARLFVGIGLLVIPVTFVIAVLQALLIGGAGLAGVDVTGEAAGWVVLLVVAIGTALTVAALALVQAAVARALVEIDAGREIGPLRAYRSVGRQLRPLLGGLGLAAAAWAALTATGVLVPVAIWLAVRWSLLAQAVELEERSAVASLRRSAQLVRGRWLRTATLVGIFAGLALAAGPLLGALLIFATDAPLALLNVVAGVVYALAMPFVALVSSYVYFDARVREQLVPADEPTELPAEVELSTR